MLLLCFAAREAHERPQTEECSVRGRGRYHLRGGRGTSDSNEGATSSGKKLKKELRSKLRLKKFLEKKAEAADGGQGPKI